MRRFITSDIRSAVADAYLDGKRPNLEQVTKKVRKAADKTYTDNLRAPIQPLTIDEWAELATYFACQAYGARQREAIHQDVALAWQHVVRMVRESQESIDLRLAQRAEELAEQARADVDEFGTPPLPIGEP